MKYNTAMARHDPDDESMLSKVAEHTVWHFTGEPILHWLTDRWKENLAAAMTGGGLTYASHLTGVPWGWGIVIGLETFALALFLWSWSGRNPRQVPEDPGTVALVTSEYLNLSLAQKVALCSIRRSIRTGPEHIAHILGQLGFANPETVVSDLMKTNLVKKSGDGAVTIFDNSTLRIVTSLLRNAPLIECQAALIAETSVK
jgi:hypothetical protein